MTKFTVFFKIYAREQYRKLMMATRIAFGAIYGRRSYDATNPYLVYDHGLLLRLLRDVGILLGTVLRVIFGLFVVITLHLLIPPLFLLRAIVIPFSAAAIGLWLKWRTRSAERAFTGK